MEELDFRTYVELRKVYTHPKLNSTAPEKFPSKTILSYWEGNFSAGELLDFGGVKDFSMIKLQSVGAHPH